MRFSILCDLQLPRPWQDGDEHRHHQQLLEQIARADALGFDRAWVVEHHFLEEAAHTPAPDVLLAAASQRTKDIRLGTIALGGAAAGGERLARVAGAGAALDLLSSGRADLGLAAPFTGAERGVFGTDDPPLDLLARMLVEAPFAGAPGIPPRNVVPKALQKPHPPLWLAGIRRESAHRAAELGAGALALTPVDPDEATRIVADYYDTLASEACVPAGFAITAEVALTLPLHVHADEATAIARGIDGAHFAAYARGHYAAFGSHQPGRTSVWQEFEARRDDVGLARSPITADGAPLSVKVLKNAHGSLRGAIGTPEQVGELIDRYVEAGVDELVFSVQTGRIPHEHALETLELFAAEVLPRFAAGRDERARAKAQRLGDAERRALGRRAPRESVTRGYAFGAEDGRAAAPVAEAPAAEEEAPPRAPRVDLAALRHRLEVRGERAFRAFVARSDDERLARTAGSGAGLKILFAAMERQFVPARAGGFTGDIQYNLRIDDDASSLKSWTVAVADGAARAHPGESSDAKLTITLAVADFVRIAAGDLDPVKAVLTGRMELAGDFGLALKLGEMFGR